VNAAAAAAFTSTVEALPPSCMLTSPTARPTRELVYQDHIGLLDSHHQCPISGLKKSEDEFKNFSLFMMLGNPEISKLDCNLQQSSNALPKWTHSARS